MAKDTVPDVEPDEEVAVDDEKKPLVSNPNDFFKFFVIIFAFILAQRISWQVILTLMAGMPSSAISVMYWLWLIPVMGVLASIMSPSIGTTAMWLFVSFCINLGVILLAWHYVLLFGNRISQ